MKIEQTTRFVCGLCNTPYSTEQEAKNCEETGKIINEWKETLKPYMWYEFSHGYDNKRILVMPDKIKFDYDHPRECPCTRKDACLYSIYYNNYYTLFPSKLIAIYTMEDAYEHYGILPKFGSSSFKYVKDQEIVDRVSALYKKRNDKLRKILNNMSVSELVERLYEQYKFEPDRYKLHEDDNTNDPCDLFNKPHPEIY